MSSPLSSNFTKRQPPECVRRTAEAWLHAKLRGAEPDFLDVVGDGVVVGVYRFPGGLVKQASHSRSKCMEKGCEKAPAIECVWANGYGRAWFCKPHFKAWSTTGDGKGDIIKQQDVPDGVVGEKYNDYPKKKTAGDGDPFKRGDDIMYGPLVSPGPKYLPGVVVKPQPPPSLDNPVTIEVEGEGTFETDPDSVTPLSRWRETHDKTAKATGTKCGDGESVGLFIPLPKNLAKKFPSLGQEDTSPSHVTFLYIGDFKGKRQDDLVRVLKDVCRRWWPMCKAVLGSLGYFDHHDKDRRVPHVCVDFDKDLSGFRQRVRQELTDAGVEVGDKFPEYRPHVTLAYMPGMDAEWKKRIPKGSWAFDKMEVWGLPAVHRLQLGPSIHKVSDDWLRRNSHRRVAARHIVRKIAGWWAITEGNPGINCPPVDKGGLMNAIPGTDPPDARYNGDSPADIMDGALGEIDMEYLMEWGRPATKMELDAVFDFCTGPVLPDGSFDYSSGPERANQWYIDFCEWLGGYKPNEIRIYQGDTDLAKTLRRLWKWRPFEPRAPARGPARGTFLEPLKQELRFLLDPRLYNRDPNFTYEGHYDAVQSLDGRLSDLLRQLDDTNHGSARSP